MITFQISGHLTEYAGGQAEIVLNPTASNVGEALDRLWEKHVGLRDRVLNERGEVRQHVNIFVNGQIVRRNQALQTPISGDAEICIMPAVSGGSDHSSQSRSGTERAEVRPRNHENRKRQFSRVAR